MNISIHPALIDQPWASIQAANEQTAGALGMQYGQANEPPTVFCAWFEARACKPAPRGRPSSLAQLRILPNKTMRSPGALNSRNICARQLAQKEVRSYL